MKDKIIGEKEFYSITKKLKEGHAFILVVKKVQQCPTGEGEYDRCFALSISSEEIESLKENKLTISKKTVPPHREFFFDKIRHWIEETLEV